MNQKDYKAIAEIIKVKHMRELKGDEVVYRWNRTIDEMAKELADHFEKKDKFTEDGKPRHHTWYNFNREQFLKDCGVE